MRSLPVQYGAIQIASVAGESRRISVSGLAKARLLWLFRNFRILDFPVLNKQQQQLVARVWNAGGSAASANHPLDVIGTIEGFSPQLFQSRATTPARKSTRSREQLRLPDGPRIPVIQSALSILLLGSVVYLGPRYLAPKHPFKPHIHAAAVAPVNVRPDVGTPAQASAEPARPAAAPHMPATAAPASPGFHPPDAMAQNASSLEVMPPRPQSTVSPELLEKTEVILRVTVDGAGRAQSFQIMRGDRKKKSEALHAARLWNFQPCPGSAGCEHMLKFTDYGDASTVQSID